MEDNLPATSSEAISPFGYGYAGFGRRFLAYVVDCFIVGIISSTLGMASGSEGSDRSALVSLFGFLLSAAYFVFFWVKQEGQTVGKRLLALKVIREDGGAIDVTTGITRYIGYLVSGAVFLLGYVWVAFDHRKQGWHDKIARTFVVKTSDKPVSKVLVGCLAGCLVVAAVGIIISIVSGLAFVSSGGMNKIMNELAGEPDEASEVSEALSQMGVEFTQSDADDLADEVFTAVNEYRDAAGLVPFQSDSKLCGYAQRRLDQLADLGRSDDHKGLYEDTADPQISKAYFTDYQNLGEALYNPVTILTKASVVVDSWTGDEDPVIARDQYDFACVRADTQFLAIITGSHL